MVAAVAAPVSGRGQRACRASGHLIHKLCAGRTRVHGLQRAKDVHRPAPGHAWHDHPVRAAERRASHAASLAAGARSQSMGHLLEGQLVPGVINLLRSAHTRSASGLPEAAISWTSRRQAPQVRAGPSAGWLDGARARDRRRATCRSGETGSGHRRLPAGR